MDAPTSTSSATLLAAFHTLATSEGITNRKSKCYKERRRKFLIDNVQRGFIDQFGANSSSLDSWKLLLATIGIEGSNKLTSIRQCKESLKGKFINIVDLVDAANAGSTIRNPNPFPSREALSHYIKRTGKVFPKGNAKANPLLRQFLIVIA
ncbi:hypothetical protein V5O48_010616 [Marasmius crinis-equi]|uniref:Uncharacterized protein n=1 Tax=Marasmius crinis-equi TaxID=585013 RepID=A0ABR3F7V8_9AGAR